MFQGSLHHGEMESSQKHAGSLRKGCTSFSGMAWYEHMGTLGGGLAPSLPGACVTRFCGSAFYQLSTPTWVAVKELKLSFHIFVNNRVSPI